MWFVNIRNVLGGIWESEKMLGSRFILAKAGQNIHVINNGGLPNPYKASGISFCDPRSHPDCYQDQGGRTASRR